MTRAEQIALDLGNWVYARGAVVAQNAERVQYLTFQCNFHSVQFRPEDASPRVAKYAPGGMRITFGDDRFDSVGVEPIFCWQVRVERDLGEDGWKVIEIDISKQSESVSWTAPRVEHFKITQDVARWLVRDANPDVHEWMAREMQTGIDALDEAWLDADSGMPTIGDVSCDVHGRDVPRIQSLMHNAKRELELTIEQLYE